MNYPKKRESTHDREVAVMYTLYAYARPLTARDMAQLLDLTQQRVNEILRGLEDKGFVYRQVDTMGRDIAWRYMWALKGKGYQWVWGNRVAAKKNYQRQKDAADERRMARKLAAKVARENLHVLVMQQRAAKAAKLKDRR